MERLHVNHPAMQHVVDNIVSETSHYSGGPITDFECVGRDAFIALLCNGLLPFHRVLDFGCGSLRLGYWLVRFLDSGCYYGIEPVQKGVEAGLKYAVGNELKLVKRPKFKFIDTCDMSVFGTDFDFVLARSILTHTTPGMLNAVLNSFVESSPDGIFLASYWTTEGKYVIDTSHAEKRGVPVAIGDELPETDYRFINYVKYSFQYMQYAAEKAGLTVETFNDIEPINCQIWLKFSRK